jgi:hypothetical protein
MARIEIQRTLAAPLEAVFELVTDHPGYTRFPGVTSAKLLREGETEPNGLGALREIALGPVRFVEEITAFERPTRMDYLIKRVNLPLDHEGGTITFAAVPEGTAVTWISTFTMPVPLVGRPLGAAGALALRRGFNSLLSETERLASSAEPLPQAS